MLQQFRYLYPQGSIASELIDIDRGLYIVKVTLQDRTFILGTGLAAAETVEKAEDKARERALMTVNLQKVSVTPQEIPSSPTKPQIANIRSSKPQTTREELPAKNNNYQTAEINLTSGEKAIEPVSTTPQPAMEQEVTAFTPSPIESATIPEITRETIPDTTPIGEPQTNIFDQPITAPALEETIPVATEETEIVETLEFDFNEIKHKTDLEMKRLNWTKEQGRDYLLSTYGKRSRLHLTDEELLEFWRYLETLPS